MDEIICDVIPIDICNLLLRRPWQYKREVIYDGRKDLISGTDLANEKGLASGKVLTKGKG